MVEVRDEMFRAYDIRGVVGEAFNPDWVESLGLALGAHFREHGLSRAVAARDCRHSSPAFLDRLVLGLTAAGIDVVVLGLAPTPALYFAVKKLGLKAGVMVTASHNPPQYNGFKIWRGASTIHSTEIEALRRRLAEDRMARLPAKARGLVTAHDIAPSYLEDLSRDIRLDRPLKIVVDGGNGAGGPLAVELLTRIGAEVIPLFCEPDGAFPNHHPDPTVAGNMLDLGARVRDTGADLGIGLDGDADRIGAVDEKGRLLLGDELLTLYARGILAERPGALILGDVKCSHLLFRDVAARGGRALMQPTGHSLMKDAMLRTGAALGGELSGHMFFADRYFGFDDALYAACRLAEIVAAGDKPLSALLSDLPALASTPELHLPCPDSAKFNVAARAVAAFKEQAGDLYTVEDMDGARLNFPDGWALVRPSNTQPVLVLRFQAETQERLAEIQAFVERTLAGLIRRDEMGRRETPDDARR